MPTVPTVPELLARRVRQDPGSPLLTYYDLDRGERTELSGVTFANWVAKTVNLIADELLLDPGDVVALPLAVSHPGHWVTLVWELACWHAGTVVRVGDQTDARVVVCGPDWESVGPTDANVVACALHPLGLGFAEPLPGSMLDYALEVRSQPDGAAASSARPTDPAWSEPDQELRHADLAAGMPGPARRVLVRPSGAWETAREALVVPLRDGGSSVVVVGTADDERLTRISATERADVGA